jgi:hypothetical protein
MASPKDLFSEIEIEALTDALRKSRKDYTQEDLNILLDWAKETVMRSVFLDQILSGSLGVSIQNGEVCLWGGDKPPAIKKRTVH